MSASGPGPPKRSENLNRPMSNLVSSPGESSSEPSSAQPTAAQPSPPPPGSRPPSPLDGILPPGSLDGPTKSGAGQGTIGASSTPDATPHPIRERNHELIDFLSEGPSTNACQSIRFHRCRRSELVSARPRANLRAANPTSASVNGSTARRAQRVQYLAQLRYAVSIGAGNHIR